MKLTDIMCMYPVGDSDLWAILEVCIKKAIKSSLAIEALAL